MVFKKLNILFLVFFLSFNVAADDEAGHFEGYAGELKTSDEDLRTLGFDGDAELPEKEELDAAYRTLARRWHPDRPNGDRVTFEKIKKAYDNLTKCNDEIDRMYPFLDKPFSYTPHYKIYKPSLLSEDDKSVRNYTLGAITLLMVVAHYIKPLQKQAQKLSKRMGFFEFRKNMTANLKKMGVRRHWSQPRLIGLSAASLVALFTLMCLVEGHSMGIQDQGIASHLLLLGLFTLTYDFTTHLFTPIDISEECNSTDSAV